jgi:hypothetical protein
MPFEIRYLDNGTGVLHVGTGTMTGKELFDARAAIFADEERTLRYQYGIIDLSLVQNIEVTTRELELIAAKDRKAATEVLGAAVAIIANKDVVFGIARMWETYMHDSGWETHVFRSRGPAELWIRERVRMRFGVVPTLV